MLHQSKFMGKYEISESVSTKDGRVEYVDDITLIWRTDVEGPHILVHWYYGDYDEQIVENYIKEYWAEQHIKPAPKQKTMDLPICYVNFIGDCLDMIKKYNLYALLDSESDPETAKDHLDEVLTAFCEPLFEYDDTVIILEEDE